MLYFIYMTTYLSNIKDVLAELSTSPNGLSSAQAAVAIKKWGANTTPEPKSPSPLAIFLSQFKNPLIYIVLLATIISFTLGHIFDSIFIGVVLLVNAMAGFVEEYRAEKAVAELKKYLRFNTRVIRDGEEKIISAEEVAVGDIIKLQNGDRVPADARLLEQIELAVDESMLTGESLPVNKKIETIKTAAGIGDRTNMIFAGTMVVEGVTTAVITAVGKNTEVGRIIELTTSAKKSQTPLQKNLYKLSKLLGLLVLVIVSLIGLWGFFLGQSLNEIFITSLALAVSTIPEGLLPSITIVLVLGARRILKKKALVKKLQAVETLGAVTVIATDKTGTLTMGEMRVSRILTSSRELLHDQEKNSYNVNGAESHILALKITSLLSTAFVENESAPLAEWVVRGKPTDRALLFAAVEAGIRRSDLEPYFIKKDYLPFDSSRKYTAGIFSATKGIHQNEKPEDLFFIMGAPEIIFAHSTQIHVDGHTAKINDKDRSELNKKLESLTAQGLRVMAAAWRKIDTTSGGTKLSDKNCGGCLDDLILVGFIALQDPLRKEAATTIRQVREAGIRPIMVTGDHRLTATAIAKELGFNIDARSVVEGKELDLMNDEELAKKIPDIAVFARISPAHKIKIVRALKTRGEVVAMIGDGTNDAPALRESDVGVAVDAGTDVAKEAADVILFDNNFKTIVGAVEEGRTIFENIKKLLIFLLADDFSEIILFIGALSLGLPLPLLPAHILWINVIEDTFPNIALTTEKRELDVMKMPPRHPSSPIFTRQLTGFMSSVAIISGMIALSLFVYLIKSGMATDQARTAILILMALDSLLFAYSTKTLYRSIFHKQILNNRLLNYAFIFGVGALLFAIFIPLAQNMLKTAPPDLWVWGLIGLVLIAEVLLIEAAKRFWLFPKKLKKSTI